MYYHLSSPWKLSSFLLTTGNSLRGKSIAIAVLGLLSDVIIAALMNTPFDLLVFRNDYWPPYSYSSNKLEDIFYEVVHTIVLIPLTVIQITNLIKAIKPSIVHSTNKTIAFLFTRGTVRETFLLKLSASKKIHTMMKNAYELHLGERKDTDDDSLTCSTQARALLNYSKVTEQTETVGGLIWCWKSFLNRSLLHKEGVMVNSR